MAKIIAGLILIGIGAIFSLFKKDLAKGTSELYRKLYTKKNMTVMFTAAGVLLIIGGLILIFVK